MEEHDVWGDIYRDHLQGVRAPHRIVRDDGHVDEEDAGVYFEAPRGEAEGRVLDGLSGRVLDLACGPGSYALHLQARGLPVTAVDASAGAIAVCRARGCADARVASFAELDLPGGSCNAVLLMGVTLGLGGSVAGQEALMRRLHELSAPGGVIVGSTLDPLPRPGRPLPPDADHHLAHHERNRSRGVPPGLVRLRIEYKERAGPWFPLWLMTPDDVEEMARRTGWVVASQDHHSRASLYVLGKQ